MCDGDSRKNYTCIHFLKANVKIEIDAWHGMACVARIPKDINKIRLYEHAMALRTLFASKDTYRKGGKKKKLL